MLDPLQRDVAPLGGQVVISDRADLAVRADQVLGVGDRVREGNVLEGEHVRHHPEARQLLAGEFRFATRVRLTFLLARFRQVVLEDCKKKLVEFLVKFTSFRAKNAIFGR
uniref:(northern house mosquito) hypothetical protein n=1 Tax=Culex pipiens TaxID=7175 RepID=A0A8D8AEY9_CULPI